MPTMGKLLKHCNYETVWLVFNIRHEATLKWLNPVFSFSLKRILSTWRVYSYALCLQNMKQTNKRHGLTLSPRVCTSFLQCRGVGVRWSSLIYPSFSGHCALSGDKLNIWMWVFTPVHDHVHVTDTLRPVSTSSRHYQYTFLGQQICTL